MTSSLIQSISQFHRKSFRLFGELPVFYFNHMLPKHGMKMLINIKINFSTHMNIWIQVGVLTEQSKMNACTK